MVQDGKFQNVFFTEAISTAYSTSCGCIYIISYDPSVSPLDFGNLLNPLPSRYATPDAIVVTAVIHHRGSTKISEGKSKAKFPSDVVKRRNWQQVFSLLKSLGTISKVAECFASKKGAPAGFSLNLNAKAAVTITTSRPMIIEARGRGNSPLAVNPTTRAPISILSANGSRQAPRAVCWLYFLAIYPSNQSENPNKMQPPSAIPFIS